MPLLENGEADLIQDDDHLAVDADIADDDEEEPPKRAQNTIILFDWDDTLCPSFDLSERGFTLTSENKCAVTEMELRQLEASVIALLEVAFEYGDVHIVTNAETGWVQLSANKFLPGVLPLLDRVKVISARSTYERLFPDNPFRWKYHAFKDNLAMVINHDGVKKNIMSFGDSHYEREAIRHATHGLANTHTKSIKFKERPKIEQLRRQIELVTSCFQYLHNHEGDLDLQLSISVHVTDDPVEAFEHIDDQHIHDL